MKRRTLAVAAGSLLGAALPPSALPEPEPLELEWSSSSSTLAGPAPPAGSRAAKAAAAEAQRIADQMAAGVQVLADADPESPFARVVKGARSASGGNGSPKAGPDAETKATLEALRRDQLRDDLLE